MTQEEYLALTPEERAKVPQEVPPPSPPTVAGTVTGVKQVYGLPSMSGGSTHSLAPEVISKLRG